jgi:Phage integrase family
MRRVEAIGLRVRDVQFLRRRISVSVNAVQIGSRHVVGPTEGREGRSVPVPEFVCNELSLQCKGKAPDALVFGGRHGLYLQRPKSSNGWLTRAVKAAGVQPITPHDLRHTCASLAVSAGVNVLALARMLGHKDPSVKLRVYADLFDTDLDVVAASLHAQYAPESVLKMCSQTQNESHKPALNCANSCAGGGIRTLTLSRAPAPKAGMSAIPSRPQSTTSLTAALVAGSRWTESVADAC